MAIKLNAALDKAFQQFQKKDYKKAEKSFGDILKRKTTPEWMKARITKFQSISRRHVNGQTKPKSYGSCDVYYFMNLGQYDKAESLLDKVEVNEGTRAYLRAEMKIEQEQFQQAAEHLQEAIKLQPSNTGYALNSPIFGPHLNREEFQFLHDSLAGQVEK